MINPTDLNALAADMTEWRHALHAIPETAFEERLTSDFVAGKLASFGLPVVRGIAGTGLVATLKGRLGDGPSIGLRADMDALDIHENNDLPYRSRFQGKMHACGHDGHMAMLLGAAHHLSANPDFAGTVHFIFQPAEENAGGGRVMLEEGLFERFPVDSVYGLHNWPNAPFGSFLGRPGPMLASYDTFEIRIRGRGAHAAMPDKSIDPLVAASQIVTALQTVVSRSVDPLEAAVVSITQIHGGDAWNVIPSEAVIRGTTRTFKPDIQNLIERRIAEITNGIGAASGLACELDYERRYPPTVNTKRELEQAFAAARRTGGGSCVADDAPPSMVAEDFAFMLQRAPGAYLWLGSGPGANLHNPDYDFNDELLPIGAAYWINLVDDSLGPAQPHTKDHRA